MPYSQRAFNYIRILCFSIFFGSVLFAQIDSERIRYQSQYQIPAKQLSENGAISNIRIDALISSGQHVFISGQYSQDDDDFGWLARLSGYTSWHPNLINVWTAADYRFSELLLASDHGFGAISTAEGHSIAAIDLMTGESPLPLQEESNVLSPSAANRLWRSGNQLFATHSTAGEYIYVYDIGIHGRITYRDKLAENRVAGAITGNDDYLLVAGTDSNQPNDPHYLRIYHLTDSLPQLDSTYDALDSVVDLVMTDSLVYVADQTQLRVLLFSGDSLSEIASVNGLSSPQQLAISDGLLYLLSEQLIEVYDISAQIPARIAWHPVSGQGPFAVFNDYIFVSSGGNVLDIYQLQPADYSFTTDLVRLNFPAAIDTQLTTLDITFANNGNRRISFGQLQGFRRTYYRQQGQL